MKKTLFINILALLLGAISYAQVPTSAQTSLKYISNSSKYQVCIKFDKNGPVSIGSSLISLCLPQSSADTKIIITSINGGGWDDNSMTYNEGGKDYHGITTTGQANMAYGVAGTELVLFEFSLPGGCTTGVRLWDQSLGDKTQTSDGTDYISNIFTPANNNYILTTNYGNIPSCPGAIGGDLELSATISSSRVPIGISTTYTLTVFNKDNKDHTNVQVKAPLPSGFTYVSQNPATNTYNPSTGIWNIGSISSTQNSVSITLTIQATTDGSFVFDAEIYSMNGLDPDSTPNNNTFGEDDQTQLCASVPAIYCSNEAINYAVSAPSGHAPYQWYKSSDNGQTYSPIAGANAETYIVTATGYYKFTMDGSVLDPQCGSQLCCPVIVEQITAGNAGTANPAYKVCFVPNQTIPIINLSSLLTGADNGGIWSIDTGMPGTHFNATAGTLDPNGMSIGTYTFTYSVGPPQCQDTETVTVVILGNCCPPKMCIGTVVVRKL